MGWLVFMAVNVTPPFRTGDKPPSARSKSAFGPRSLHNLPWPTQPTNPSNPGSGTQPVPFAARRMRPNSRTTSSPTRRRSGGLHETLVDLQGGEQRSPADGYLGMQPFLYRLPLPHGHGALGSGGEPSPDQTQRERVGAANPVLCFLM